MKANHKALSKIKLWKWCQNKSFRNPLGNLHIDRFHQRGQQVNKILKDLVVSNSLLDLKESKVKD